MATITYACIYTTSAVGASGNKKIQTLDASGAGNVTVTNADNSLSLGETFTAQYGSTTLTLTYDGGGTDGFFAHDGSGRTYYLTNNTTYTVGTQLGTPVTTQTTSVCFTAGTLIETVDGDVAVENLQAGMLVRTASGELRPVKWLGIQPVSYHFMARERLMPVTLKAGALGNNLPKRDLTVSPGHAILIDGVLCNASALINGTTIVRHDPDADFSYYHVELDTHDLLISEGVASESYLCTLDRNRFVNAGEYETAFGADGRPVMPMALPRATVPSQLPQSVRERLQVRRAA